MSTTEIPEIVRRSKTVDTCHRLSEQICAIISYPAEILFSYNLLQYIQSGLTVKIPSSVWKKITEFSELQQTQSFLHPCALDLFLICKRYLNRVQLDQPAGTGQNELEGWTGPGSVSCCHVMSALPRYLDSCNVWVWDRRHACAA